jgi:hypothetical protein
LLPGGRLQREADEGMVVIDITAFFPLPFGRPSLRFSGTPPHPAPPVPGHPMADMVGLRSSEAEEEELECAFDPEQPQHLKKSEEGEEG